MDESATSAAEVSAADRLAELARMMPFSAVAGIQLLEATPERVAGRMAWAPDRCTAGGILHGGALMTLADSLGGICAFLNLPSGMRGTSTVESKTNFFRPVSSGGVHAVARPLHTGRRLAVIQTELRDDEGRLVAQVTQTQLFLD
jgi:1,4-dihydroxy-2-naphthoyl-CoA hydrolase